jgi:UPF0271 protein
MTIPGRCRTVRFDVAGRTIDLNADVGEGFGRWSLGDDEALLAVVSSANVACGFHAGDPAIMRRTCAIAVELGVRIGAHVGYRDLAGFGRRAIDVEPDVLGDEIAYQLGGLAACAGRAGAEVAYVKPHGALYHRCSTDAAVAEAVVEAVARFDPGLGFVGAPGGVALSVAAEAGLDPVAEGFADRGYGDDGALLPRSLPGAVLAPADAVAQAVRIATERGLTARNGADVALDVRTLCVHGDTPDAATLARAVRRGLQDAGVAIASFA